MQLYASTDTNRLAILSYQADAKVATSYNVVLKIFTYANSTWSNGAVSSSVASFTTLTGVPSIFANPTLDVIALWYTGGASTTTAVPVPYILSIDTTTNAINSVDMSLKFNVVSSSLRISSVGKFVYFYQKIPSGASVFISK